MDRPALLPLEPNRKVLALRVNAGLSRNALAVKAGVDPETVKACEAEGYVPTERVQRALAEVFGMLPLDIWPLDVQAVAA